MECLQHQLAVLNGKRKRDDGEFQGRAQGVKRRKLGGYREYRLTFFHLPPEIRNMIYEYTLREEDPIQVSNAQRQGLLMPSHTRVCRQMYWEIHLMYYTVNNFCLTVVDHDVTWLMQQWAAIIPMKLEDILPTLDYRWDFCFTNQQSACDKLANWVHNAWWLDWGYPEPSSYTRADDHLRSKVFANLQRLKSEDAWWDVANGILGQIITIAKFPFLTWCA